jgi:hypothetical protein
LSAAGGDGHGLARDVNSELDAGGKKLGRAAVAEHGDSSRESISRHIERFRAATKKEMN